MEEPLLATMHPADARTVRIMSGLLDAREALAQLRDACVCAKGLNAFVAGSAALQAIEDALIETGDCHG
jgi:hypothetical protein